MTQAQEGLQMLLDMAEDYRKKNNMDSVMVSAVGGGTGHAYAYQGIDRVDVAIGKWQKETPGAATPREMVK